MSLVAPGFRLLYAALFSVFVLFGTSMTVVGATLPKILGDFGWSYGTAGAVIAASSLSYFLFTLFGGAFIRRFGAKATIVGGLTLGVLGLSFFAATPAVLPNLLLNALIGSGQGACELVVSWSVLRMDRNGTGRAMSVVHGAFSIGAVAGPVVIGLIVGSGMPWTLIYRGIALVFGLITIALAILPFDLLGREKTYVKEERNAAPSLARNPAYWLGFASLLLYVGAEIGISNWVAEYFVKVFGTDPARSSFMVSLFWIGLLAGRFGAPVIFRRTRQDIILVASASLLALAALAFSLFGYSVSGGASIAVFFTGAALTFLTGLGCSVIYPFVLSLVGACFPAEQSRAISFSVAGGGLGIFAFPFLASWIAQAFGIRAGFLSFAVLSLGTLAAAVLLVRARSRNARARESGMRR
jgi:fucose permease